MRLPSKGVKEILEEYNVGNLVCRGLGFRDIPHWSFGGELF